MSRGATARLVTPPGAGAIGIVRLQGDQSAQILASCFQPIGGDLPALNQLRYGHIVDEGEILDEAIVSSLKHRGMTTFDISVHGGCRILERLLGVLERSGAVVLPPTDSSAPPVWTGRSRLDQEALDLMGDVRTKAGAMFLASQRSLLPAEVVRIVHLVQHSTAAASEAIQKLLDRYSAAKALVHGVHIVITGVPNSGKSSLFNRLVGREAAVVSPIAGTTRDWVTAEIELGGVPFTLVDTAGSRAGIDPLEQEAIVRGARLRDAADGVLYVLDSSKEMPRESMLLELKSMEGRSLWTRSKILGVMSKCDLPPQWSAEDLFQIEHRLRGQVVPVSSRTGQGISALMDRLQRMFIGTGKLADGPAAFSPFLVQELSQAQSLLGGGVEGIRQACDLLQRLINPAKVDAS